MLPFKKNLNQSPKCENLQKSIKKWNDQDRISLHKFKVLYESNWTQISKIMKLYTDQECKAEYLRMKKDWIETHWTRMEDKLLFYVLRNQNIPDWALVSIILRNRSPDECQRRWAILKKKCIASGGWGYQEQIILFTLARNLKCNWKYICLHMPLRTRNLVKGFFHATYRQIKKKTNVFWCLEKVIRWPTFIYQSNFFFY